MNDFGSRMYRRFLEMVTSVCVSLGDAFVIVASGAGLDDARGLTIPDAHFWMQRQVDACRAVRIRQRSRFDLNLPGAECRLNLAVGEDHAFSTNFRATQTRHRPEVDSRGNSTSTFLPVS